MPRNIMDGHARGKLVMPRITGKEVDMFITGKSAFSTRKAEKERAEKRPAKVCMSKVKPRDEVLTQASIIQKYLEKPRVKLPAIASQSSRGLNNEERYDLQALLRVRCFDFSLQVRQMIPEWTRYRSNTKSSTSSSSCFQPRYETFGGGKGIPRKGLPFVMYNQNNRKDDPLHNVSLNDKSNVLPLSSSILQGQRVNLREKYKIDTNNGIDFMWENLPNKRFYSEKFRPSQQGY